MRMDKNGGGRHILPSVMVALLTLVSLVQAIPILGGAGSAGAGFGFFDYSGACYDITTDLVVSTENITFTSGSCIMSANITIQSGLSFTLKDTTLTLQDPAFGSLQLWVSGHIVFDNAVFTKAAKPAWALAAFAGAEVDVINHSLLEGGKELLMISPTSTTEISNSTFRNFWENGGIATKFLDITSGASLRIRNNVFDGAWGAIFLRNGFNNYIINNTFRNMTANVSDDAAVLANNESGLVVYNNRFIDTATGVAFNKSTTADIIQTTFDNCTKDVIMNASSIAYTYQNNDTKDIIRDAGSRFRPFRYMSVEADWESDGDPVVGANIIFSNVTGAAQVMATTDAVGRVDIIEVVYEEVGRDIVVNHTPFNVSLLTNLASRTFRANVTQDLSANTSVKFVVDDVDPVLTISFPPNGLVTNVHHLIVNGTTDVPGQKPPNNITVEAGGTFASVNMSSGGAFEANITPLMEGTILINITARDQADNSVTMNRSVLIDWTAPKLLLYDPRPDMLTDMPVITLNGTTDINATLTYRVSNATYQGAEMSLFHAINGAFFEDIVIPEGRNRINVTARDPAGNTATVLVNVTADFTPPGILMLKPITTEVLTNDMVLRMTGILSEDVVNFYVEGVQQPINASRYFDVNVTLENVGLNMIGLTVFDAAGNFFSLILNVTLDLTPPHLVIYEPYEGAMVTTPSIEIRGKTDPDAYLTINGLHAFLDGGGGFSVDVDLVEGDNEIVLKATDPAGNKAEETLNVTRDTILPTFEVLEPMDGLVTNEYPIDFVVRTERNATVYAGDVWTTVTDVFDDYAIYKADVYMTEGKNVIDIWVTDKAGNAALTTVTVFLDTYLMLGLDFMPSTVTTPTYMITGFTDPDANVTVDGHGAEVDPAGYFSYKVELKKGHNQFIIVARDPAGNRDERSWNVNYETGAEGTDKSDTPTAGLGGLDPWCLMIIIVNVVIFVAMYASKKAQQGKGPGQGPPQTGGGGGGYGGGG